MRAEARAPALRTRLLVAVLSRTQEADEALQMLDRACLRAKPGGEQEAAQ